ncbi:MAG TPA: HAD-IIB family hydrolase [Devosia sp.]|nr:HAD-IIB family hydrolase [Devosia sp.]
MLPLAEMADDVARGVRAVLTDIDDTLTDNGRLRADTYLALERLHEAGLIVVPVTGRPAGWCDLIARQWPVDAVVGENGAFWFRHDDAARKMIRRYMRPDREWQEDRRRLDAVAETILRDVPGTAIAADQAYRSADLAIDFSEDVPPLPPDRIDCIVAAFEQAGAHAKVSSIHVNAWFGDHDKLTTSLTLLHECFGMDDEAAKNSVIFVGDSPNDAPMFGYFPRAVGVANVGDFSVRMPALPAYVTERRSGPGFVEFSEFLLRRRGQMPA